jgi:hypothetical protein
MKKTFYIFSFRTDPDFEAVDYDWAILEDTEDYDHSEMLCARYMIENDLANDYEEATDKLEGVYKQDRGVMLRELLGI